MYQAFWGSALGVNVGYDEAVELAAHHGFSGIYLDVNHLLKAGTEPVVYLLEERNLRPAGWHLPFSLAGEEASFQAGMERLPEVAEACARTRATRCSTWLPPASDERTYREMYDLVLGRLEKVCQVLDQNDTRLGLEFVGPSTSRRSKTYEFIYNMEGMLALCRAVSTGNCGLLVDCWHVYTSGGHVDDVLDLNPEDVVDVHINDAPEGVDRDQQVDSKRCLPGATGVIDVPRFLRNLKQIGYDGPVMCEPFSERLKAMDADEAVATTKEAMDDVWPD